MYSIGEMAKLTGVRVTTIRYFENEGLLPRPERNSGNQRRYDNHALERLTFIRHARDLGISPAAVRELIALSAKPETPCGEVHRIAENHLEAVRAKIRKLKKLENELERITALGDSGHIGECNVIASLGDHARCESEHDRI